MLDNVDKTNICNNSRESWLWHTPDDIWCCYLRLGHAFNLFVDGESPYIHNRAFSLECIDTNILPSIPYPSRDVLLTIRKKYHYR